MRLEHEAAALGKLTSPWACPLLDFGWAGDSLELVRPYIPGLSLQSRLENGPLFLIDALTVGAACFPR